MEVSWELNGAEALMGFLGWLTTREKPVTFSRYHNAAPAIELFEKFAAANDIGRIGPTWPQGLKAVEEGETPTTNEATETFQTRLARLINHYSLENGSDTPDFLLAAYLTKCLDAWNEMVTAREKWYGRGKLELGGVLVPRTEVEKE